MVLLAPMVTVLQILLVVCRDIVYNTTKSVYVCWSDQRNHRVGTQQHRVRLGNEEVCFVEEFRYLGHVMTVDCRDDKDINKQVRRQNTY